MASAKEVIRDSNAPLHAFVVKVIKKIPDPRESGIGRGFAPEPWGPAVIWPRLLNELQTVGINSVHSSILEALSRDEVDRGWRRIPTTELPGPTVVANPFDASVDVGYMSWTNGDARDFESEYPVLVSVLRLMKPQQWMEYRVLTGVADWIDFTPAMFTVPKGPAKPRGKRAAITVVEAPKPSFFPSILNYIRDKKTTIVIKNYLVKENIVTPALEDVELFLALREGRPGVVWWVDNLVSIDKNKLFDEIVAIFQREIVVPGSASSSIEALEGLYSLSTIIPKTRMFNDEYNINIYLLQYLSSSAIEIPAATRFIQYYAYIDSLYKSINMYYAINTCKIDWILAIYLSALPKFEYDPQQDIRHIMIVVDYESSNLKFPRSFVAYLLRFKDREEIKTLFSHHNTIFILGTMRQGGVKALRQYLPDQWMNFVDINTILSTPDIPQGYEDELLAIYPTLPMNPKVSRVILSKLPFLRAMYRSTNTSHRDSALTIAFGDATMSAEERLAKNLALQPRTTTAAKISKDISGVLLLIGADVVARLHHHSEWSSHTQDILFWVFYYFNVKNITLTPDLIGVRERLYLEPDQINLLNPNKEK